MNDAQALELARTFPGAVMTDLPLRALSRWKIGGTADVVVTPRSTNELAALRAWIHQRGLPSVVIGATSNLLFADEGLNAIMIRITSTFGRVGIIGSEIIAEPGAWVPGLSRLAMTAGLSGLEHTCGIPGTLGGLICMNGGSQRKGIGDVVKNVTSVTESGRIVERTRSECEFAYRASVFQKNNEVICEAKLHLEEAVDKRLCRQSMLKILKDRRSKFPQKLPNCGSVFVSNPEMYAEYGPPGKIIEQSGFKGYRIGDAMVSQQHANFIVNIGNAKASEIITLISEIKHKVFQDTGYLMVVEARYVNSNGTISAL